MRKNCLRFAHPAEALGGLEARRLRVQMVGEARSLKSLERLRGLQPRWCLRRSWGVLHATWRAKDTKLELKEVLEVPKEGPRQLKKQDSLFCPANY